MDAQSITLRCSECDEPFEGDEAMWVTRPDGRISSFTKATAAQAGLREGWHTRCFVSKLLR